MSFLLLRLDIWLWRGPCKAPAAVLTLNGEWRRTRLFRSHEQAELLGAIADTRAMFEGKGWA